MPVARYYVIIDREVGEQDYAGITGQQGGHNGSATGAIEQVARELQETAFDNGMAGFFEVVGREIVPTFDTPRFLPGSIPELSSVVAGFRWPRQDDPPIPQEYRVTWEIDVTATNPEAAARQAREIQMDPTSTATVFAISGDDAEVNIDLSATPPKPPHFPSPQGA